MTDFQPVDTVTSEVALDSRSRRLRRRSLRRSSSEDVIVIDSPVEAQSSRASRRRRREITQEENTSIVDLTCSPDEIVDLTSPEFTSVESFQPAYEISDEETERDTNLNLDISVESPKQSPLSCPVCLERFSKIVRAGGQIKSTTCGHVFCDVCIHRAIQHSKKCPACRKKLDMRKIHTLYLPV